MVKTTNDETFDVPDFAPSVAEADAILAHFAKVEAEKVLEAA